MPATTTNPAPKPVTATAPKATTDNQPIVGAYGDAYTAPPGTAKPTDITNPGAPWVRLGLISEDGASWKLPEEETTDIKAWQTKYPIRTVTTSLSTSVSFALMEWDRDTIPFALGGGHFTTEGEQVIYHPPGPGESESRALFVKVLDGDIKMGLYYSKGRVIGREDSVFKPDEAALLSVEFGIEGTVDDSGTTDPYNLVFDKASFPPDPAPPATGATAGSPGTWTPSGATAPATLTVLQAGSVTASPATGWTTGQHMLLGDNSRAHWSSTAWVTGDAA